MCTNFQLRSYFWLANGYTNLEKADDTRIDSQKDLIGFELLSFDSCQYSHRTDGSNTRNKHCKHCGWGSHATSACPNNGAKKATKRSRGESSPNRHQRGCGGKGRGKGGKRETQKYECWMRGSTKHFPWECHKKKKAKDTDANSDVIYEYVCFNCMQEGHMVKDCPHPLNYRRSKANKKKFWKCVEDGTDFSDLMITPAEVMKARPPPMTVSSDDEEYTHAIVCKG